MSIIHIYKWICVLAAAALFTAVLPIRFSWGAGSFERDPVVETQTKVVAVTEETLKNYEKKPGAPAPTFKLVNDSDEFLVEEPVEKSGELETKAVGFEEDAVEKASKEAKNEEPSDF